MDSDKRSGIREAGEKRQRPQFNKKRLRRRFTRFVRLAFFPPKRFDPPELEKAFLTDYARRFASHRRAAAILALATWTTYFGWDWFHAHFNTRFADYLMPMMALRALGTISIASCIALLSMDRLLDDRKATWVLGFAGTSAYAILVVMMFILPFPYNYMFYFIGLLEVLLFNFGLLRLLARPVIVIEGISLLLGMIALPLSSQRPIDAAKSITGVDLLESYYSAAAITYLISFILVGLVIAIELERTARTTFLREQRIREVGTVLSRTNNDLVEAQREAAARTEALIGAKDEMRALAEQQNRDKSRFLASAAHDLRQPMQALSNLLEAAEISLERGDLERGRSLLMMSREAANLTRTTFNSVLDISRLESGFVEAELSNFALGPMLAEVSAGLAAQAELAGVELRLRNPANAQVAVRSDRHLLSRVVSNLLGNAIKYSDPAKGPRRAVVLGAVALANKVRIDIVDNGVGIDPAKWQEIFRPFVQLGNEERDRNKGIGLGLSIVQASIDLLPGHRLDMRSRPGAGSRFSIELPLAATAEIEAATELLDTGACGSWEGAYVLYVEDDAMVRQSTEQMLAAHNVRFESFGSVAELKTGLERFEMAPDLILSDYRLPDGRTADDVVILSEAWFEEPLPVVVLTGEVSLAAREGWQLLHKPVAAERLLAAIAGARSTPRLAAE